MLCFFFFFNDTATTEIYTLSLHDALPICARPPGMAGGERAAPRRGPRGDRRGGGAPRGRRGSVGRDPRLRDSHHGPAVQRADRKSTRLNSSHANISYAVFCLKKKKNIITSISALYINCVNPLTAQLTPHFVFLSFVAI